MQAKTIEGLVGARINTDLINTPRRAYEEAERKGDTATMERAMGYMSEHADKAEEYRAEAEEGMKEDAKDTREKAELDREEAIQKRKEDREEFEKRIEENRNKNTDIVEISEDGRAVMKDNADSDSSASAEINADVINTEPVVYTKTGEVNQSQREPGTNISVSV